MTRLRRRFLLLATAASCMLGVCVGAGSQTPPGPTERTLACGPEKPSAWIGETVTLRAWVASPENEGERLHYDWTVSAGQVTGDGSSAQWRLHGVPEGLATATVRVRSTGAAASQCSLVVLAKMPDRDGANDTLERESGRTLLVRGQPEGVGYGLYSYVLFGSPPTEATRARYTAVVDAYWGALPAVRDLETILPKGTLNVTYLPVTETPGPDDGGQWARDHYDYARARALLRTVAGDHRDGPYIISTAQPIVLTERLAVPYLYQDLTPVPADLASSWATAFLNQAAQERFADKRGMDLLLLRIRTVMVVASKGVAPVANALGSLITIVSKQS